MKEDENMKKLLNTIYLCAPAIFRVGHLKKFIANKFMINTNLFSVEISYKVKTIVLPDHYTLMDVCYIYKLYPVRVSTGTMGENCSYFNLVFVSSTGISYGFLLSDN
jgi:hypothetical protein